MGYAIKVLSLTFILAAVVQAQTSNANSEKGAIDDVKQSSSSVNADSQQGDPSPISTQEPKPPITLKHRDILPDAPQPIRDGEGRPCPGGNGKPCAVLGGRLFFSDSFGLSRHNRTWSDAATSPGMLLAFGLLTAATIADIETAQSCIKAKTCREGNPIMGQSRAQEYGVAMSLNAFAFWAAAKEKQRGRGVVPLFILWGGTVLHATLAAHNSALAAK
jgi:hypothetical protein